MWMEDAPHQPRLHFKKHVLKAICCVQKINIYIYMCVYGNDKKKKRKMTKGVNGKPDKAGCTTKRQTIEVSKGSFRSWSVRKMKGFARWRWGGFIGIKRFHNKTEYWLKLVLALPASPLFYHCQLQRFLLHLVKLDGRGTRGFYSWRPLRSTYLGELKLLCATPYEWERRLQK